MIQLAAGLVLASAIAAGAYRLHALSQEGAIAAACMGTIIFGLGGWQWAVLLLAFFVSSSALTRAFQARKRGFHEKFSKGGERDAGQVFGNGGLAAAVVLMNAIFPGHPVTWLGFAAGLAAVNADTWATELGILNPAEPRSITDLRKAVEAGTSGGISLWGTVAAVLGAGLIGLLAALLSPFGPLRETAAWHLFAVVLFSGLMGSLIDSFLGATVQAMYYCPVDRKETEKHPRHTCGAETVPLRGWTWLNNDWVNFACGLFGIVTALLLAFALKV